MDPRPRDVEAAALLAPKKNYFVGLGLLGIVVLLWTSSNYLIQNLLEGGYDKPFLLTYLSTSTFALYLVPFALREREAIGLWWKKLRRRQGYDRSFSSLLSGPSDSETLSPLRPLARDHTPHDHTDQLTTAETAKLALKFSFFWFIANWSVNASLAYTSVASTTILTTTSGFFTLGVGALFKVEKFTLIKCGAVIASFCGVVLVALSDSTPRQTDDISLLATAANALFGDSLALFSALFYALYVVLLKVGIGSEDRIQMQLFFGFIGIFTFTLFWPFGLLLHATGMESFALPHGRIEIISVLFNCSITFVSDYLFLLAMLKTTPLLVTIGLSMTIPTALIGDWFLGRPTAAQALLGGAFVLAGFIIVGLDDAKSTNKPEQLLAVEPETVERHD